MFSPVKFAAIAASLVIGGSLILGAAQLNSVPFTIEEARKAGYVEEYLSNTGTYGVDTFGETYQKYLVGTNSSNNWWWARREKKFFDLKEAPKGNLFKNLYEKNGQEVDKFESLKKVCMNIYSTPKNNVLKEDELSAFRFCSPLGKKKFGQFH
ncbi:hypothetical protein [Candidatus Mycoplasma haematohominis]|uniref:hypothetical protein n=1 Tax=Candidatus Mycoplasma haematohominis TaxID=1494318 RepID=UPI001C0A6A52|nr:hypothetical protein [Candidatus Mycoplasma haemohominis]